MTVTTRQSSLSVTRPVNNGTFTILGEGTNHRRVALIVLSVFSKEKAQ